MRDEGHDEIVLMGHSTGGLLLSIYTERAARPVLRACAQLAVAGAAGHVEHEVRHAAHVQRGECGAADHPFPGTDNGFYRRSISVREDGEWTYNHNLKGDPAFLVRIGWLSAIMAAQGRVAHGLDIDCPCLVAVSERTDFRRKWDEALSKADIVLDVNAIAERARCLGDLVVLVRIPTRVARSRALGAGGPGAGVRRVRTLPTLLLDRRREPSRVAPPARRPARGAGLRGWPARGPRPLVRRG